MECGYRDNARLGGSFLTFATGSVPSSSSSPCDTARFSGSPCSLVASTGFDFLPSSGVCDFLALPPDFVARTIISWVLERTAAASAVLSTLLPPLCSCSSSSSDAQPNHFDLPFFLGVAFLTAIPFFLADLGVPAGLFFGGVVVVVVDGRHVGQNHSPGKGAAVIRTHSQWYHVIGQSGSSQQIQFSELSGSPQVQV